MRPNPEPIPGEIVYASRYASLSAALAAAAGKTLRIAAGTFTGLASLAPANGTVIEGAGVGATVLHAPASPTAPVFDLSGVSNVTIRGLSLGIPSGAASSRGYGVHVHGNSTDVLIENVRGDGFVSTVQAGYGSTGASDGTVERLTLRNVTALNSPTLFGICIDDCDTATIDNCHGRGNQLDGLKLRKKTSNVTIIGGAYTDNVAGDGMDAYAGGESFTVIGTIFANNGSAGFTIKTGDLNQSDAANYGYVRDIQLVGVKARDNAGTGAYITTSNQADLTEPVPSTVQIVGGLFEGNGLGAAGDGLYVAARNVTVTGAVAKANGRHGFVASPRAVDTAFLGCFAIANAQDSAGGYNGFDLHGNGGKVLGCTAIGVDAATVAVEGDYAALTKYQQYGVRVNSDAAGEWTVDQTTSSYHTASGNGLRTDMASGVCVIHQRTAGNPTSVGGYGSIGSRAINTSAAGPGDVVWTKTSGNPNAATTGWTRSPAQLTGSTTFNWSSIANGAQSTTTVTVTGAALGDHAQASMSVDLQGMQITAHVSAADTVTVVLKNDTGGAIDLASGTLRARITKAV